MTEHRILVKAGGRSCFPLADAGKNRRGNQESFPRCAPTGRIFGESIANMIAAYSAQRYVSSCCLREFRDGLTPHCLRKVLDYIESNLDRDLAGCGKRDCVT